MLLVDDLQHLCRYTYTVSEFLHTLNAFSDLRRKFVIAADRRRRLGWSECGGALAAFRRSGDLGSKAGPLDTTCHSEGPCRASCARRRQSPIPDGALEHLADMEEATPRDLIGALHQA